MSETEGSDDNKQVQTDREFIEKEICPVKNDIPKVDEVKSFKERFKIWFNLAIYNPFTLVIADEKLAVAYR